MSGISDPSNLTLYAYGAAVIGLILIGLFIWIRTKHNREVKEANRGRPDLHAGMPSSLRNYNPSDRTAMEHDHEEHVRFAHGDQDAISINFRRRNGHGGDR